MAGTITGVFTRIQTPQGRPPMAKLVLTCTADAADHSYPVTVLNTLQNDYLLLGKQLYSIKCIPGTTGPTTGTSITITDEYGVDLLGGKGSGLIHNSNKTWALFGPAGSVVSALVTGTLTATITGNSVNSAVITIVIELIGV
jgi:hypothetical protein